MLSLIFFKIPAFIGGVGLMIASVACAIFFFPLGLLLFPIPLFLGALCCQPLLYRQPQGQTKLERYLDDVHRIATSNQRNDI